MFPPTLLPELYRKTWCVAGGYAACPAMADDIDVWVYDVKQEDIETVRAAILEYLHANANLESKSRFTDRIIKAKRYYIKEAAETRTQPSYMNDFINIVKVAVVYGRGFEFRDIKPIHIMVTDAHNPGELINGFDISTHAVAIDWNGRVHTKGYTHPAEQPRLLMAANENTPKRMEKICKRYGHPYVKEAVIG